ncbi:MAG: hypothetical protein IT381_27430 [Deltaproteobacteria bacterium]|nr:hypothetical protein [Deltaproteobacteria bacterium]
MSFILALLFAAPLEVHYLVKEEVTGWQPIEPDDVERTLGQTALEVLTKSGGIKLVAITEKEAKQKPPKYLLRVLGRMIDEAETHTVYLSFEPGTGSDLGSLRASQTMALGRLPKATMLARITDSAKQAAGDLWKGLEGAVTRVQKATPPPPLTGELPQIPWKWADVVTPKVVSLRAADDLYSKDGAVRKAALRELTSLVLAKAPPRNALEACALKHPDTEIRKGCLVALRPVARESLPTQRVVIEVFRQDQDSQIVQEASDQMQYFVGLSQADAIAAWIERASKAEVYGPFAELGDQPNLDLAIARCMIAAGKRPKYQRSKAACIELLKPVPHERRFAILWPLLTEVDPDSPRYFEGAGEREGSIGTDWQRAVEALLEDAPRFVAGLDEVLWRRYERTLSSSSLDLLASHAEPNEKLTKRMLEAVQTGGNRAAMSALRRFADESEAVRPLILEGVSEMLATESYHKSISKNDLEQLVKRCKGEKR